MEAPPGFEPGGRFCRFNGVVNRVVSCWSLVCPAPPFYLVLGPYWTTFGLRCAVCGTPRRTSCGIQSWRRMRLKGGARTNLRRTIARPKRRSNDRPSRCSCVPIVPFPRAVAAFVSDTGNSRTKGTRRRTSKPLRGCSTVRTCSGMRSRNTTSGRPANGAATTLPSQC